MSSVTQKNPIRLFVCHVWAHDDDYDRVFEYLESSNNFFYRNTSTPDQRPQGDKEALREEIKKEINARLPELGVIAVYFTEFVVQ